MIRTIFLSGFLLTGILASGHDLMKMPIPTSEPGTGDVRKRLTEQPFPATPVKTMRPSPMAACGKEPLGPCQIKVSVPGVSLSIHSDDCGKVFQLTARMGTALGLYPDVDPVFITDRLEPNRSF